MTHGVYEVTGRRDYRGHKPGTVFVARLNVHAERRAIFRGDIRLLERMVPTLPERWRLPEGWAG